VYEIVAEGLGYVEGPITFADGRVLLTDIRGGAIRSVDRDGKSELYAQTGGGPNGLARGPQESIFCVNNGGLNWVDGRANGPAADYVSGALQRIGADHSVSVIHTASRTGPLVAPNDIALDHEGGIWFTDSGRGLNGAADASVCYLAPDLKEVTIAADGYRFSNGLAFNSDESDLIVAESGTGELWIHPVVGPGELGPRRLFTTMSKPHRPDGICIDTAGNVIVAGVLGAGVMVYDRTGSFLERIAFDHRLVTNVAFGGTDHATLYVTEAGLGRLSALAWPRPGIVLPFSDNRKTA
jgi:gluconolactonase